MYDLSPYAPGKTGMAVNSDVQPGIGTEAAWRGAPISRRPLPDSRRFYRSWPSWKELRP